MTGWSTDTQHRASQTVFLGTSTSQVTTGYQPCSSTNVSICAKVSPVLEWIFRTQDSSCSRFEGFPWVRVGPFLEARKRFRLMLPRHILALPKTIRLSGHSILPSRIPVPELPIRIDNASNR